MPVVRVIIYGAGAVGSVIGGRLRQGGADVVLVARPAHAAAIRQSGLALRTRARYGRRRHRSRHVDRPTHADRATTSW